MPEAVVGRARNLKLADVLRHAARRGQGGLLFLDGEPGIGETTLVDEASDRAAAQGFTVRRARGAKDQTLPPARPAPLPRPEW